MLEKDAQISFFDKIFNLHGDEWPKVGLSWVVRFLYRSGFVVGWTIIVAMFVSRYGIGYLPYLFIINAFFAVLGSLFYATFLEKMKKNQLMIVTLLFAVVVLGGAQYFAVSNPVMFFMLLLVAESIFLVQFRILMDGFIEDLFTPLQSERAFPVIEAAETIGGILAGLLITSLSSIDAPKFVLIWIALLLPIFPCLFFYKRLIGRIEILREKRERKSSIGFLGKLKKDFANKTQLSFLKGVILIVLLQWFLFNLVEFQYTKAVYQDVSNVIIDSGSGFEHSFVHELGFLFAVFSSVALLIQFFIGSRLINYLGVVGTMILHGVVTLLSLFPLTFAFRFSTAMLMKNNFNVTSLLFTNAYHSSYYAIKEQLREYSREFLEGIVRPVGALLGTLLLIVLQLVFAYEQTIWAVNLAMIFVAIGLLFVSWMQQDRYTDIALLELRSSSDNGVKFNAVDILAQRGHKKSIPILRNIIEDTTVDNFVRIKSLKTLSDLQDEMSIPIIVRLLSSKDPNIRYTAVVSLAAFEVLQDHSKNSLYDKYSVLLSLKALFRSERTHRIRSQIIRTISKISDVAALEFLLGLLKSSRGKTKADVIYALGNFTDDQIVSYLEPFLESRNVDYRVNAAIALYRHDKFRFSSEHVVNDFLLSKKPSFVSAGLFAVGELKLRSKKKICKKFLNSSRSSLKLNAAIALAKMKSKDSISVLVELLFSDNPALASETRQLLKNVDVRILKNIDRIVRHLVSENIDKLIKENSAACLDALNKDNLVTLKKWYTLVDRYDEVELINKLLATT